MARALACAQTTPVRGDVATNVAEHVRLAALAAEEGARVLVFPELSLTGYELDLAGHLAFSRNDPRLSPLADAASATSLTLIVGAPVRLDEHLCIGAFIIAPDRTIDVYTKHHLGAFSPSVNPGGAVPPPEASVFQPGDRNPFVRLGNDTAAVAVCADCGRPAHAQRAADLGAKAYLAGTFTIPLHLEATTARLKTYAERHSMAVVFANYCGASGGLASAGRSAIWSESGESLAELDAVRSGVVIAIETPSGWRALAIQSD